MRNFDSFLSRRKITDVQSWLSASGIGDIDSLARFCEVEQIKFEPEKMASLFKQQEEVVADTSSVPKTKKVQPRKTAVKKPAPEGESSTWHTPAAERPISKPKRARKAPARSRAKKTTTKKD